MCAWVVQALHISNVPQTIKLPRKLEQREYFGQIPKILRHDSDIVSGDRLAGRLKIFENNMA